MIRSPGSFFCSLIVSIVLLVPGAKVALAQAAAPPAPAPPAAAGGAPTLAAADQQSNNPQAIRPKVEQYVGYYITALAGADADAQAKARQALSDERNFKSGTTAATPAFLDVYTQVLGLRLEELAKHPDPRIRLNAAVVGATVAAHTRNPQLTRAAIAFLNDQSPAIVLWGLKAARALMPTVLAAPPNKSPLTDAVVQAVTKHPKGLIAGALAMEGYSALQMDVFNRATPSALFTATIEPMQKLLEFRVGEYRKGIPPEPRAERIPTFYLTHGAVWTQQTPQQRVKTMQLMSDLLALAAEQAKVPDVPSADRVELVATIGSTAQSISVASANANVDAVLAPLTRLADAREARLANFEQVLQVVPTIFPAIKADQPFAALNPPPQVTGHEAAPPPASAPTTGPVEIPGAGPVAPGAPGATPAPAAPAPTPAPTAPAPQPQPVPR